MHGNSCECLAGMIIKTIFYQMVWCIPVASKLNLVVHSILSAVCTKISTNTNKYGIYKEKQ